jgi:hypothetical protein
MSHPPIDTNPSPALVLAKLAMAAAAVADRPEMHTTETLQAYRRAALRLAQAAGTEITRRTMP